MINLLNIKRKRDFFFSLILLTSFIILMHINISEEIILTSHHNELLKHRIQVLFKYKLKLNTNLNPNPKSTAEIFILIYYKILFEIQEIYLNSTWKPDISYLLVLLSTWSSLSFWWCLNHNMLHDCHGSPKVLRGWLNSLSVRVWYQCFVHSIFIKWHNNSNSQTKRYK